METWEHYIARGYFAAVVDDASPVRAEYRGLSTAQNDEAILLRSR